MLAMCRQSSEVRYKKHTLILSSGEEVMVDVPSLRVLVEHSS